MKPLILGSLTLLAWIFGVGVMVTFWTDIWIVNFVERTFPIFVVVMLAALVAYVIDPFRNPRVPEPKKKLWAAVLLLAHVYAQPFYWWWYLRPTRA